MLGNYAHARTVDTLSKYTLPMIMHLGTKLDNTKKPKWFIHISLLYAQLAYCGHTGSRTFILETGFRSHIMRMCHSHVDINYYSVSYSMHSVTINFC